MPLPFSLPIQETFDSYFARVIPKGASQNQVIETRRAYFAGAAALLGLITKYPASTDEDFDNFMKGMNNELVSFATKVTVGEA